MNKEKEFNNELEAILKNSIAELMSDETNDQDPMVYFKNKSDYDLNEKELDLKISLLRLRCGHWFITHGFTKNDELEFELKILINIRDEISERNKERCN